MNLIYINKNHQQSKKPDIARQVQWWDLYAKLSPLAFIAVMSVFYFTGALTFIQILYVAGVIFATTAITWWFWTIHTISAISKKLQKAETGVNEVLSELKSIRQILSDFRDR